MAVDKGNSTDSSLPPKAEPAVVSESDYRRELAAEAGQGASVKQLIDAGANREGDAYEQGAKILGAGAATYPPAPSQAQHAGVFLNGLSAETQTVAPVPGIPVDLAVVIAALEQYEQKVPDVTVRVVLTPSTGELLDGGVARHGDKGTLIFIGDAASVIEELSHVTLVAEGNAPAQIGVGMIPIIPMAGGSMTGVPTTGGDDTDDANNPADTDNPDLAPFFARLSVSAGEEGHVRIETHVSSYGIFSSGGESLLSQEPSAQNIAGYDGLSPSAAKPASESLPAHPATTAAETAKVTPPEAPVLLDTNHAPTGEALSSSSIAEGSASGTVVGVVTTTDPDSGDTHTYSLTGNAGGRFAIDSATGVVTVADGSLLDYATGASQAITVRTTDHGGLSLDKTFAINVTDVAPGTPIDGNSAANSVSEGAGSGATVGITAQAVSHGGALTYSLAGQDTSGLFTINASTGVVTVADAAKLDYDTSSSHTITVRASDPSGAFADQNFTINISQVALTGITDSDVTANSVSEGASNGATVGVTALATNPHGDAVTYSLTASDSGAFAINASTGVVTVADATKLNYDTASTGVITVEATEASGQHVDQNFTISVSQVALTGITDSNGAANSVSEGASNGATVGVTALATNPHSDAVTYSLTATDGGAFAINSSTGVITVADATKLNYDTATTGVITVEATEASGQHVDQNFTISISQVALTGITDSDATANSVSEGASNGAAVGVTALATNPHGDAVTYSLTASDGGAFTIDASTGVVTVADGTKLDYETATTGVITVEATEASGQHVDQAFTINVTDVAPGAASDTDARANSVTEGAANGTSVGITAHATDPNGGAVTYSLPSDSTNGGFAINSSTGVVTVADGTKIDYDTAASDTITVRADLSGLHSDTVFTINVSQVALTGITDSDATANGVAWSAGSGTAVGITALATNPHGDAVTYSLTSTDGGAFTIDSSTAIVTVADPTKLNAATTPDPSITVRATEASGQHVDQNFTISVSDDAPTTTGPLDQAVVTSASTTTAISVDTHTFFADADIAHGDALTYSYSLNSADSSASMPGWLTFNTTTGVFSGTAPTGYAQNLNFTLTATDSAGESVFTTADLAFGVFTNTGTTGADTISGSAVYGGAGGDSLTINNYNSMISGGAGNDTLNTGNLWIGTLYGGSGNDSLVSHSYDGNFLFGGSGNDTLSTAGYGDRLTGGSGADLFQFTTTANAAGTVITDYTQGTDHIEIDTGYQGYAASSPAEDQLTSSISGSNTVIYNYDTGFSFTLQNFTGTLTSADFTFNNYESANGVDTLQGGDGIYLGIGGNDSITASNYVQFIYGGSGNDTLSSGGYWSDYVYGGDGNDSLVASSTNGNFLYGGAGNDTLSSGGGANMTGGTGTDIFKFTAANSGSVITDFNQATDGDVIDLTTWTGIHFDGTAAMSGSVKQVDYSQSGGNTIVYVDTDGDNVSNFSFTLDGLYTLTRGDFIFNGDNIGTSGNDTLNTGNYNGWVNGMAGDDSIVGNYHSGLYGGAGNDTIQSTSSGLDSLSGGSGNDLLITNAVNTLTGGSGNDTFSFPGLVSGAVITDFTQGADKIQIDTGFTHIVAGTPPAGDLGYSVSGSNTVVYDNVTGFSFTLDNFTGTLTDADFIYDTDGVNAPLIGGTSGADTIGTGSTYQAVATGQAGDDSIVGNYRSGLYGGAGNDTITSFELNLFEVDIFSRQLSF